MDIALKQRLVGATVLIALAVVVLPMLLGGRPDGDGSDTQTIELPPQPSELDFETRRYPLGEEPSARTESRPAVKPALPTPRPVPQQPDEQAVTEQDENAPAEQAPPELPPPAPVEEQPKPDLPAVSANGSYVVQVGSFGSAQNANRLAARLTDAGYAVLSDTVRSANSTVHRVRVGPYGKEAQASQAVEALTRELGGIKPRIIELSPSQGSAQSVSPADPLARWVVQVGSFSSASNAEKLVAQLRLASHSAFQEEVSGSAGTIYRVRVGPFLEREEAIRVDQQIKSSMSLDGVVLSVD